MGNLPQLIERITTEIYLKRNWRTLWAGMRNGFYGFPTCKVLKLTGDSSEFGLGLKIKRTLDLLKA